ncbi:MAG: TolC family protein [Elusimicrobiota bacterium]
MPPPQPRPGKPAGTREQLGRYYGERFRYMKSRYPAFDPVLAETHLSLIRTSDMLWRMLGRYLRPYDLTPPAMGILILLESGRSALPMRRLSRQMVVTQANVTGLVDTLEKRGLVRRRADPGDRRVTLIEITETGRGRLNKLLPGYFRLLHSVYGGLGRKKTATLSRALETIRARLLPFMGLALLLAAPAARATAAPSPEDAPVSASSGPAAGTLRLRAAVETALRGHPALQEPRSALDRALAAQMRLLGDYDTSLTASLRRLDSKTPPHLFFGAPRTTTDSFAAAARRRFATGTRAEVGTSYAREQDDASSTFVVNPRARSRLDLSLAQSLLKGMVGRPERAALRASALAVRSARASLGRAAERLARDVSAAYWELWRSRRDVEVLRASVEEAREFLETTRKLFKRYEAEKDDLLRAEADLLAKELEVLASQERVRERTEDLRVAAALSSEEIEAGILEEPAEPEEVPSAETALARALELRKDLRALRLHAEIDRINLDAAAGLGLPTLDLTGAWGWSGLKTGISDSLAQLGRMGFRTWSVGLDLSYAFGTRKDRGQRLDAETARALSSARVDQLRREIEREITVAVSRLRLAGERVRITRRLETMQEEVLKISRQKYGQGRITSRERLESANAALLARSARLAAVAQHAAALSAQKAGEGALLEWLGVPLSATLTPAPGPVLTRALPATRRERP